MFQWSMSVGVLALVFNLLGGVSALFGIYLVSFKAGVEMFGWGDARTFGYLFLCVGLCFVFAGILIASALRQR
ncbi:MAG: hypothetical protein JXR59_09565 [Desulfuromonadaceae bacterium]|nr:hypothetical protein [Desulfuromonadaceae bacterium]